MTENGVAAKVFKDEGTTGLITGSGGGVGGTACGNRSGASLPQATARKNTAPTKKSPKHLIASDPHNDTHHTPKGEYGPLKFYTHDWGQFSI